MNKGFTLTELLAVILVLGFVLVIAVPKVIDVIDTSKKATFTVSVKNLLEAADSFIAENPSLIALPNNGNGTVVTAAYLYSEGAISKLGELEDAVVVIYNDDAVKNAYELYAFASNSSYTVAGYLLDDVSDNVIEGGGIDYATQLIGVTSFTLSGIQLVTE